MTEELKDMGLEVGHRRVGRLMSENGIEVKRNKKFKVNRPGFAGELDTL